MTFIKDGYLSKRGHVGVQKYVLGRFMVQQTAACYLLAFQTSKKKKKKAEEERSGERPPRLMTFSCRPGSARFPAQCLM